MSRFWAAGGASSGSESSEEDSSDYSSDGSAGGGGGAGKGDNRWVELDSESSSEEEDRVVKSGKERALDAFQKHIAAIRTAMKVKDYYKLQTEFDALAKAMIKAKAVLAQGVPRPLVRILCDLEDYIPERLADKEAFKKLSARQGRALNRMKLTLKKHNKAYQVVIKHYRANPVVSDSDDSSDDDDDAQKEEDSDDDDSDEEDEDAKKKKKASEDTDDSDDVSEPSTSKQPVLCFVCFHLCLLDICCVSCGGGVTVMPHQLFTAHSQWCVGKEDFLVSDIFTRWRYLIAVKAVAWVSKVGY